MTAVEEVEEEDEEEAMAAEAVLDGERKLRTFLRACVAMVLGERCIGLPKSEV